MNIAEIDGSQYVTEILDILNHSIVNTTALFDYEPRTPAMLDAWIVARKDGNYPIIGALDDNGRLMGFASYGPFRTWPAYKYTVEHSLYVHPDHRRKGIARKLLSALIEKATDQDYHVLIGVIEAGNTASIQLHINTGFKHGGTLHQVGYKFDKWLDVDFYEYHLPTPYEPCSGPS